MSVKSDDGTELVSIKTKVQGKEVFLNATTFCELFELKNDGDDFQIDTKDKDLLEGVEVIYRDVCDTSKADTPESFELGKVRTRHLLHH